MHCSCHVRKLNSVINMKYVSFSSGALSHWWDMSVNMTQKWIYLVLTSQLPVMTKHVENRPLHYIL